MARSNFSPRRLGWVLGMGLGILASSLQAGLLLHREEAFARAFPKADRIVDQDFFLTEAEVRRLEKSAKAKLASELVTLYRFYQGETLLGYGILDTREVRSKMATSLVVFDPQVRIQDLVVCAFHEPKEYLPVDRWFRLFVGKPPEARLRPGEDLPALTGATLSVQSFAASARVARALVQELSPRPVENSP